MSKYGLQEQFLNSLRKAGIPATFYFVNGFQMKGILKAFDNYTMIIECGSTQQFLFKHAVSTIMPSKTIILQEN